MFVTVCLFTLYSYSILILDLFHKTCVSASNILRLTSITLSVYFIQDQRAYSRRITISEGVLVKIKFE